MATTNETGAYNVPRIARERMNSRSRPRDFRPRSIRLHAVLNQTARIDVAMKVGQVSETVEVSSSAPLLQTQSTEISTIIDAKTNASLPWRRAITFS